MEQISSFSAKLKLRIFKTFLRNLTEDQKQIANSIRFGPILDLNCSTVPRYLSVRLAKNFDVNSRTVHFDNGSSFVLDAYTVHQILGIPIGGLKIPLKASKDVKEIINKDIGNGSVAPTVDHLFSLMKKDLAGDCCC